MYKYVVSTLIEIKRYYRNVLDAIYLFYESVHFRNNIYMFNVLKLTLSRTKSGPV